jgi:hypothetical protein
LLASVPFRDVRLLVMALALTPLGIWGSIALLKRWSPRTTYYVVGLAINALCLVLLIWIFAGFRLNRAT